MVTLNEQPVKTLANNLELLLLDVDGVLTDGSIVLAGEELDAKRFNVKDGMGITMAQIVGIEVGIITGRTSRAVSRRAGELHIEEVFQSPDSKQSVLENLIREKNLDREQVAYMGDDVQDLPVLRQVGLPLAPADASPEIRDVCKLVAEKPGGRGAVRELIERILEYRQQKKDAMKSLGFLKE